MQLLEFVSTCLYETVVLCSVNKKKLDDQESLPYALNESETILDGIDYPKGVSKTVHLQVPVLLTLPEKKQKSAILFLSMNGIYHKRVMRRQPLLWISKESSSLGNCCLTYQTTWIDVFLQDLTKNNTRGSPTV